MATEAGEFHLWRNAPLRCVSGGVEVPLCVLGLFVPFSPPEDEGVLITSLVKKLQKTPWVFSTLWEAVYSIVSVTFLASGQLV